MNTETLTHKDRLADDLTRTRRLISGSKIERLNDLAVYAQLVEFTREVKNTKDTDEACSLLETGLWHLLLVTDDLTYCLASPCDTPPSVYRQPLVGL